jgi:3-dehydroquinate synthase
MAPPARTDTSQHEPEHRSRRYHDRPLTLNVDLGERSYPIHIGRGLLDDATLLPQYVKGKRVAIVTNDKVGPLYLDKVAKRCARPASRSPRSCCPMARKTRTGPA